MRLKDYLAQILQTLQKIEQKQSLDLTTVSSSQQREPEIRYVEKQIEVPKEVVKIKEVVKEVSDTFSLSLAPFRRFQQLVQADNELYRLLLREAGQNESENFIRLLVTTAQWDKVELIWQTIAERCKQQQRPASEAEQQILHTALQLFNFTTRLPASLQELTVGIAFNFELHQRGNSAGNRVCAVWLPGLINSAGKNVKLAVVETA